ncbi:MAG: DUF481 domain-containing protein [Gammaproteobacteria bacterium]|nr:DUF481 domain-containing protein [Gammaproteobacteria bacterium]
MKNLYKLSCLTLALASSYLSAQETEAPASNWEVSSELGALVTTGNTESTSVVTKVTAIHNLTEWKNKYTLATLFRENETVNDAGERVTEKTAQQFAVTAQGDYKLSDTSAVFAFGSYTDDKFGAFAKYLSIAAGYSFRPVAQENLTLDMNVGPGFSQGEKQNGTKEDGFVVRASADLSWKLSANAKFTQNVSVEHADFNTRTTTESALVSNLNSSMKMKFGFKTLTNSDVDEGVDKTDTETSATIIVSF